MRSILFASAFVLLAAGEAAAQIERLDPPPGRTPPGERGPGEQGRRELLFIAPSGEPFRGPLGSPYPVAAWFAGADADHDGRLTQAEFAADSLRFFEHLDVNHDNVVDGFEAQAYERSIVPELAAQTSNLGLRPPPRRGWFTSVRAPQHNAEGAALYGLLNEPQPVNGADGDLDRKISRAEATTAAARRFRSLDSDNDGALTLSALPTTAAQSEAGVEPQDRRRRN